MPQQVRKGEELHEERLKQFLINQNLISDLHSPLDVVQFSNGYSNLTYLLQIEDKEWVLRRPPFGAIKRGHDMGREYKVLSNLQKEFSKSPKAYTYTEDLDILGAPFYIMEKMEGIILNYKEALKRKIDAPTFQTIASSWLDTYIELHQVDYKAAGLEDLGRPEGYVSRQVTNWGKQYLKAATMEIPEAHQVMEWMETNQPQQYNHCLIHNDYKYDNIVFANDQFTEVNAVLDWEMCTLGDPLMDLGTSIAYWTMPSDNDAIKMILASPTLLEGNPTRSEVVQMYAQKSGQPIQHLVFYYVFGLFKIAVIVQQIFYRYNKGLTNDPKFAQLDQMANLLIQMAWGAIQRKKID